MGYSDPEEARRYQRRWRRMDRKRNPEKYRTYEKTRHEKNKEDRNEKSREYHHKNKEELSKKAKERRLVRSDFYNENRRKKRELNPEYYREQQRQWRNRTITPRRRLNSSMSGMVCQSIKDNKNGRHWESLVGYTLDDLMKHIEKQFQPGMTWENRGRNGWHVDHKIPVSVFNFTHPEHPDFKRCWELKNLQPLWAKENLKKGAKLEKHFQPRLALGMPC